MDSTITGSGDGKARPRVFSGVQPTGDLHLGTYLGALRQWAERQHERENVFCVVDLHALTVPENLDAKGLRAKSREVAALYLACGIDPEESIVFVQSHVREHAELTWLLNCTTPLGWLQRMTQFKSKSDGRASVSAALLNYPVLQAADILLYDTDEVPVGEDQVQHVELTRDIGTRFNHMFGETFRLPKAVVPKAGARVMGFDDPEVKMSKSLSWERDRHAVHLLDDEARIRKTVMSAVTDSGREFRYEQAGPGVRNLLGVLHSLRGGDMDEISASFEGKGYGDLKKAVVEAILDTLRPIRAQFDGYMADPASLDAVLAKGAERARAHAARTLARAKDAMGVGA
ncbi:MAG: tryptophan--tRNA ligase [Trueperaceae bacterium]|nr:tryptophan--tRNA ligase [Trueperaceae bacterium]